jgi:signal transduction histidine kinase
MVQIIYDIIKAHSGTINGETMEGGGAEFIISLPYP